MKANVCWYIVVLFQELAALNILTPGYKHPQFNVLIMLNFFWENIKVYFYIISLGKQVPDCPTQLTMAADVLVMQGT